MNAVPVNAARSGRPVPSVRVLAVLLLATTLGGCSTISGWFGSEKSDYRTATAKNQPLDVPPDLTQLARDSRYQPQGGVVSASAAGNPQGNAAQQGGAVSAAGSPVALAQIADIKVERAGQQRWLVVPQSPEQLWPLLKAFWEQRGFTLAVENQPAGVMETNWAENRSKLPNDIIRGTIGRLIGGLYDTGERDLYRTRIERTPTGSEVYITHRGLEEVYTSERKESTAWRPRQPDPQLEAEFLSNLMIALGNKEEPARAAVAAAPDKPSKARPDPAAVAANQATTLLVEEPFDRAWRRVGLALDRGGFSVEDRDRAGGIYYVRYIDPRSAGKDEPGWWSNMWAKLFGETPINQNAVRYRIALKPQGDKQTNLSVQTSTGAPDTGDNAKRIVGLLINELK